MATRHEFSGPGLSGVPPPGNASEFRRADLLQPPPRAAGRVVALLRPLAQWAQTVSLHRFARLLPPS